MAGMGTGTILLLAVGGGVLLYMLMGNKSATSPPTIIQTGPGPTTAAIQAQALETNAEIAAGSNTVNNLINSIFS